MSVFLFLNSKVNSYYNFNKNINKNKYTYLSTILTYKFNSYSKERAKWKNVVYYPDKAIKSRIEINEDEVAEIRWISPEELEQWLSQAPADFSTWFAEAYALAKIKI